MDLDQMRLGLNSDRPPLELDGFGPTYQRMRIAVNVVIPPAALLIGAQLGGVHFAVHGLVGISLLILLHSALFPKASFLTYATFDTIAYVFIAFLLDLPEIGVLVAVTQALTVFLHVPPRRAVQALFGYTTVGVASAVATTMIESAPRSQGATVIIVVLIALFTAFPAAWMLSQAAVKMLDQRAREETLSAEKDLLLKDKDRFVASVSHELRTPLTAVVGLAHTLAEDPSLSDAERAEFINMIVEQSEEVAAIVDDLLVAARAGSGHLTLVVGEVNLRSELASVLPDGMQIDDRAEGSLTAVGDPIRIRQILRNLVSNAGRYGGPAKRVVLSGRGAMAVVSVQDNGTPIPEDQVEDIFSAYGRAHDRPGRTDSVGLGLTVSRQLARMMGGDVRYNHSGVWAEFELQLPRSVSDTARAMYEHPDLARAAHGVTTAEPVSSTACCTSTESGEAPPPVGASKR